VYGAVGSRPALRRLRLAKKEVETSERQGRQSARRQ